MRFTGAEPERLRVRGRNGQIPDRTSRLPVKYGIPCHASVGGLPNTPRSHTDVNCPRFPSGGINRFNPATGELRAKRLPFKVFERGTCSHLPILFPRRQPGVAARHRGVHRKRRPMKRHNAAKRYCPEWLHRFDPQDPAESRALSARREHFLIPPPTGDIQALPNPVTYAIPRI